jgi:hypothetical protein
MAFEGLDYGLQGIRLYIGTIQASQRARPGQHSEMKKKEFPPGPCSADTAMCQVMQCSLNPVRTNTK